MLVYLQALVKAERISLSVMGVDSAGFIDPQEVAKALTVDTALVTVMHSNNEVFFGEGSISALCLYTLLIFTFTSGRNSSTDSCFK